MTTNEFRRFLPKVYVVASGCWEWSAYRNPFGYAIFALSCGEKRTTIAHRLSYEHFIGPVPEGFDVDHLCRNRCCVNPTHLEAVTRTVNIQRGAAGDLISPELRQRKSDFAKANTLWKYCGNLGTKAAQAIAAARTHCGYGHEYVASNLYYSPAGKRHCRECLRRQQLLVRIRRRIARRRAEQAA